MHSNESYINTISILLFAINTTAIVFLLYVIISITNKFYEAVDEIDDLNGQIKAIETKEREKQEKEAKEKAQKESKFDLDKHLETIIPREKPGFADVEKFTGSVIINISKVYPIVQGIFYIRKPNAKNFKPYYIYAKPENKENLPNEFETGDGLTGQAAKDQKVIELSDIPGSYMEIKSGLGKGEPAHIVFIPVLHKEKSIGLIELGAFKPLDDNMRLLFNNLVNKLGESLNKIITEQGQNDKDK
jgi:hypothetical protein